MTKFREGLNFHTNTKDRDEWLTPPYIISCLGKFDLDPCAPPASRRPWNTAKRHFSKRDNGLEKPWKGRVWLNPPYGKEAFKWLEKLSEHDAGGVALIFARTETKGFDREVWKKAKAVFFFQSRIAFHKSGSGAIQHTANAPSCLVVYTKKDMDAIEAAMNNDELEGTLVQLR